MQQTNIDRINNSGLLAFTAGAFVLGGVAGYLVSTRRRGGSTVGAGVFSGIGEAEGKQASPYNKGEQDIVEEASWESFPASDSPAW